MTVTVDSSGAGALQDLPALEFEAVGVDNAVDLQGPACAEYDHGFVGQPWMYIANRR